MRAARESRRRQSRDASEEQGRGVRRPRLPRAKKNSAPGGARAARARAENSGSRAGPGARGCRA